MSFATAALYVQAYWICMVSIAHPAGAAQTGFGISMA